MRSFEIFVEPELARSRPEILGTEPAPIPAKAPAHRRGAMPPFGDREARRNEVLDLFIHGANVTARVTERHASCVLRDLAWALADLVRVPRGKRIVRFYEDAWELCVERLAESATLSVYRGGAEPTVLVYDREVVFEEVCASVVEALDATLARHPASSLVATELVEARRVLEAARADKCEINEPVPPSSTVAVDIDRDAPISFAAEFSMRPGPQDAAALEPSVERADLHALLVRGRMRAEIRGRSIDLGETYPFLFAERLLDLGSRGLDAWERGQPFFARVEAGGVMVGLRASAAEGSGLPPAALTITPAADDAQKRDRTVSTFPELSLFDVVEAALAFGRALVRALVRRDRTQGGNLRLAAFRRDVRTIGDTLREVRRQDARINPAPESYRAFAHQVRAKQEAATLGGPPSTAAARLRYVQRWRALVPGIDLRSTFLCGDKLIIGAALETFCLERTTGELVWRKPTPRAASVVTPAGIARIAPDGTIELHDFATGDVTLRSWIAPRAGGPCAGAVVNTAGLPKLLIVTEGDKHLVAIDLTSGEARWRYAWGRASTFSHQGALGQHGALRLKRVGKLLYVASGDSALTAVDVQTGAVVWRVRDRLRFCAAPAVDHDTLFAVAGGASSAATLHAIDPYSGQPVWSARLPSSPCTVEGPPLLTARSVAVAVRDRRGLRLSAFDRETGAPLFHTDTPVAPVGTSWLAVDDLLVGNTPTGDLVAVDGDRGGVRWKHALGSTLDSDVPRKLEPVLRSGALFVPHTDVQIFRPSDGAHLGTVGPCDAIPDLLRVDERCDVYVAEESGHMVAFGAGPRLSLVR
ncbi:MAG: PQQ-binding-like beta-propeller repeat protein [Labilithrix sp.]|nr:PQQ-binding-like beta-propeller repeat protein [Labilithrix sp.]